MNPGLVWTAPSAQFGHDHQTIRVRMESLLDDLIGHVRSVVVASIDVVYAGLHCLAKNSNGGINVPWRSPDAGSGELHRTVSHAVQSHRRTRKSEASSKISLFDHFVPPCYNHLMKDSSGLEFAYAG
jgi:hypothetical protein